MKRVFNYFIPVALLFSCSDQKKQQPHPPQIFPSPQIIEANPPGGYTLNQVTGDTIEPVASANGVALKTGVPVPARPVIISRDSIKNPVSVPLNHSSLQTRKAHPNRYQVSDNLPSVPVNEANLKTIKLGEGNPDFVLLNEAGDTIPTGVPIPVKGKVLPAKQPSIQRALAPGYKDAASSNIQFLDVDQGMKSSYVLSLCQDKRGNIWLGTHNGGVSKYNGESLVHFTETEGLSSNAVLACIEDRSGNLWFGTGYGGVCKYDGENFTHYTEEEGMSKNVVNVILEDQKGNLWFGTDGGGVTKFDGNSFIHFTEKEGLSDNLVFAIEEDRQGNLWFGTARGGVNKFDGKYFTHFNTDAGLNSNVVLAVTEDLSGNIWFGTWGAGATKYDGKSLTHYTESEGLNGNHVKSILSDKNGNLWFATRDNGVSKFTGQSFTRYTEKEGLSNNTIWSLLQDKSGNLWFGTKGGGVCRFNEKSFQVFTEQEGLSENVVHTIYEDKRNNLWFGTKGGGVIKYDGESFTSFTEESGLSNNHVWAIAEDRKGDLWFGTWGGGVNRFDGKTFYHYSDKEIGSKNIYAALTDNNGDIWFGTSGGGLTRFDGNSFFHFTEQEGLGSNNIESLTEDKAGNLWFGSWGGGLTKYDGNSFTHFTEKEGLANNKVKAVTAAKNGDIWFTSWEKGVTRYNGKQFENYTQSEGLSADMVWSFMEDNQSNIWIGTESGLNAIQSGKTNTIHSFGKQDGLRGLDFYANSSFIDSKNRAWWGSGKGLTMLDLNRFQFAADPPSISLNYIEINQHVPDYRNLSDSLEDALNYNGVQPFENFPLNLELKHDQNHLTFHFSGIDWHAPHKVKYSYIMEGLNDQWSQPSPDGKADYRSLPYGNYSFKVRAIGESGRWSEAFVYPFSISAPWWHSWWARLAYVLITLLIVLVLVKWRTTKLKQRQSELEKEIALATLEIRDQKEEAEKQRDEVRKQKEIVEEAHQEIKDSINYAKRIQRAILPPARRVKDQLPDSFIFYRPKDIVAGDFYWLESKNEKVLIAAADCTGHGVPGAMVSVVCNNGLNRSVREHGITDPGKILDKTREIVIAEFEKSEEEVKDGMDISLCVFEGHVLHWAGANNPLWIIREGELIEIKADKQPIGKYAESKPFTTHRVDLQEGDAVYIFTDGFQDQFGGEKGKKFKVANFKKLLVSLHREPMEKQHVLISNTFDDWKGNLDQVDDICLIGVKV